MKDNFTELSNDELTQVSGGFFGLLSSLLGIGSQIIGGVAKAKSAIDGASNGDQVASAQPQGASSSG
jgi:bacteriocin-like protein